MTRFLPGAIKSFIPFLVLLMLLGMGRAENEVETSAEQSPVTAPDITCESLEPIEAGPQPEALPLWREYLAGKRDVRVGLASKVSKISLYCEGDFQILIDGAFLRDGAAGEYITFSGEMKECITLVAEAGKLWTVRIDGRPLAGRYPGTLEVFFTPGNGEAGLTLINEVPLEVYIAGVTEKEMPASFSLEALRAQAISARSYTLSYLDRHEDDGFDLCAGTHCHVYRGRPNTFGPAASAAFSTRRQIIVFEGQPVRTFYHSTCGGITADGLFLAENSSNRSYLAGGSDTESDAVPSGEEEISKFLSEHSEGYCSISPKYRWRTAFTAEDLDALIQANLGKVTGQPGLKPGKVKSLRVRRRHGARVEVLEIDCESGCYAVRGNSIRWLFQSNNSTSSSRLMSTLFSLHVEKKSAGEPVSYVFFGGGWGHGVGMCQWGAEGRARAGASAMEILAAYFPGTQLWTEEFTAESEDKE